MENKKNIYKRQFIVSLVLSIMFTIFFVNWFKQPNVNEAVWINGLFLLIPLIIVWTFCLSYFNKYRKERKLD
jgi:glucan phosphoethanolaminetransferase (alkaline phosphatase superfamily)